MVRHGLIRLFLKPLSWIPNGPRHAAYAAALGLVTIQVGMGIILKAAQNDGKYAFSPSASVTISEFFKMLLSTIFFYRECRQRAADGIRPSTRGGGTGYSSLASSELPTTERSSLEEKREEEGISEIGNANGSNIGGDVTKSYGTSLPHLDLQTFWSYIRGEVTVDVRYGFCNLALFYVLINNSIFVSYKLADPGTIQLTKSGVTFITALVMITTLNTKISKIQWIAIIIQICGLMVTQYSPETGTTYPFSTYLILIFQVFLSASSGVYNQSLLKTDDSSLHADNMVLYAAGSAINLVCHVVIRNLKVDEPGFFTGYDSLGAIMVIVSNVFIGLAITAVYKYADAVIKCFATAVATGILLYISPILFGSPLSFLVLPGTIVVFIASWLYMDNPPPKAPSTHHPVSNEPQKLSFYGKLVAVSKKKARAFFVLLTGVTIIIVAALTMMQTEMPNFAKDSTEPTPIVSTRPTIESPFKNTMAVIRWNTPHRERIPLLMKYQPFFHTVHISMPRLVPHLKEDFHNITHDQWPGSLTVYVQLAHTMKLILDTQPKIDGLLYYHFDAWIDPLAWVGQNPHQIWFPSVVDVAPPTHGGPQFMCMDDASRYKWWGWRQDVHKTAIAASNVVDHFNLDYKIKKDEWCVGWSDIYYIPRRFFADYIFLAEVFGGFSVFHEVAVPTIVHIIDQSRRRNPYTSVIDRIGDCWGSCCASNPTVEDVLWARCGHRLNYLAKEVTNAFYDRLDAQAAMLGRPLNSTRYAMSTGPGTLKLDAETMRSLGLSQDINPIPRNEDDGLEDDEQADKLADERKGRVSKEEKMQSEQQIPASLPYPPPAPPNNKREAPRAKRSQGGNLLQPRTSNMVSRTMLRREAMAAMAGLGY